MISSSATDLPDLLIPGSIITLGRGKQTCAVRYTFLRRDTKQ